MASRQTLQAIERMRGRCEQLVPRTGTRLYREGLGSHSDTWVTGKLVSTFEDDKLGMVVVTRWWSPWTKRHTLEVLEGWRLGRQIEDNLCRLARKAKR